MIRYRRGLRHEFTSGANKAALGIAGLSFVN
jgi:hypothetical protein